VEEADLAALCWYGGKIRGGLATASTGWQHRTPPSAGGCHPIDLWVVEQTRIRWYDPVCHALCELEVNELDAVEALYHEVDTMVPIGGGKVIWLVAIPERTSRVYSNSESLIWRDAGVVLATLVYTAEALGLSICPVGILGGGAVQRALPGGHWVGAGGCVVGSRIVALEGG
jgi:hypothetical protein